MTLVFLMGAFLICWLPFFIWMPLVTVMKLPTPKQLYFYILWIGYANSAVNPLIYALHHSEFKQVFTEYWYSLISLVFPSCYARREESANETESQRMRVMSSSSPTSK